MTTTADDRVVKSGSAARGASSLMTAGRTVVTWASCTAARADRDVGSTWRTETRRAMVTKGSPTSSANAARAQDLPSPPG